MQENVSSNISAYSIYIWLMMIMMILDPVKAALLSMMVTQLPREPAYFRTSRLKLWRSMLCESEELGESE